MKQTRTTIYDIALEAGVSHCAVSTVMNNRSKERRISPATEKRIREVAERLNYRPNLLSRGLKGGKTHSIGLMWRISGPHDSVYVIEELCLRIQNHGCVPNIAGNSPHAHQNLKVLEDFSHRRVDGMIYHLGHIKEFDEQQKKIILDMGSAVVVSYTPLDLPVNNVIHDLTHSLQSVIDHFIASGRRKPAYFIKVGMYNTNKINIFRQHLRDCGLNDSSDVIIDYAQLGSRLNRGEMYAKELDKRYPDGRVDFDSILCSTDEGAAATIDWLESKGYRVPEDIAVVGFNDVDLAKFFRPRIASVNRQQEKLVDTVEKLLFEKLENPNAEPKQIKVPMEFVWRPSAGGVDPNKLK